jgi:hypothetical protein
MFGHSSATAFRVATGPNETIDQCLIELDGTENKSNYAISRRLDGGYSRSGFGHGCATRQAAVLLRLVTKRCARTGADQRTVALTKPRLMVLSAAIVRSTMIYVLMTGVL